MNRHKCCYLAKIYNFSKIGQVSVVPMFRRRDESCESAANLLVPLLVNVAGEFKGFLLY